MEKGIAQKIKKLADQMEQLSIDVARRKQGVINQDDLEDIQELSDRLFAKQSELRYDDYFLAKGLWEE